VRPYLAAANFFASMPVANTADCWFLSGPTASGKTHIGIELSERLGAEILSLDSMAIYRHLDIGTAKPNADQRRQAPHHLIDLVEPDEQFSLASYLAAASSAVAEIRARQREPLFVGGTPLYLKALLRGIFEGPPADWQLRRQLQDEIEQHGLDKLYRRLSNVDPQSARRLHPHDARRIIRALEVFAKTGQPISQLQQQFELARPSEACRVFVLQWPRDELHRRINQRVDAMFAEGLVDEVRTLLDTGRQFGRTAAQALGYREVLEHLAGQPDLAETIKLVKTRTRQFAKRQETWFRSLSECTMVSMTAERTSADVIEEILQIVQNR
jgi:tRNA dimethylallyltransferase